MVPTWLKSLFPRRSNRTRSATRSRPAHRPNLVQLEDRAVPANISIADATVIEGNTGTTTLMFTVTADNKEGNDITFKINTADISATAGTDYVALVNATGTIAKNTTSTTVLVTVNGDKTVELDEKLSVTLSNLSVGNTFTNDTAIGTITNDDQAKISISSPQASEGAMLAFSVTIDNPVDVPVTADRKTADGSAKTSDNDYTALPNTNVQLFAADSTAPFIINVATTSDNTVELDEMLSLVLSNLDAIGRDVIFSGGGASLTGTGTINNDDTATLTIADAKASEGTSIIFTATLSNPVDTDITVKLTGSKQTGNTATEVTDFSTSAQTITITAGNTTGKATVTTVPDAIVEGDETFTATLSNLSSSGRAVTGNGNTATGTILNDDTTVLTFDDQTVAENAGTVTFTIKSSLAVQGGFSVVYKTVDGTAKASGDYKAISGDTLVFTGTANETKTFTVTINEDNIVEGTEDFTVAFTSATFPGGTPITSGFDLTDTGLGKITDNDSALFKINANSSATEGSPVVFTVTLTNPVDVPTSVTVTTADVSATGGTDYTSLTGMVVNFPALSTSQTVNVTTTPDTIVEPDETFTITLGGLNDGGRAVTIDPANKSGSGKIIDDDTTVLTVNDVMQNEDAGKMTFTVTLSNGVQGGFKVDYKTTDVTAMTGDNDYLPATGTLTFSGTPGEMQTFTVTVNADTKVEPNENFLVSLFNVVPTDAGIPAAKINATDTALGKIIDDDTTALTVDDVTQNEDAGNMTFTVTLSNAVQGGFTVQYQTTDGTAKSLSTPASDKDYTAKTGTLTFAGTANEKQTFTVTVNSDTIVELDEFFNVSLFNVVPTDAGIPAAKINATDTAKGMITNDDAAEFKITKMASAAEGSPVMFMVTLTNPVDVATSVTVSTTDGTAKSPQDFTALVNSLVSFPAGTVSQTVSVITKSDNMVEPTEDFTISLGNLVDGGRKVTISATDNTGTGMITSADKATFSIADVMVVEGNTLMFTVSLSNAVAAATSVKVTTSDLTANDPNDYKGVSGFLVSFPAGTTSQTVMIPSIADTIVEADETFKIMLSDLDDGGLTGQVMISATNGTAIGKITNDDKTALTVDDVTQNEDAGNMTFTVTLSNAVQSGFTVQYQTTDGSAKSLLTPPGDKDYTAATGTLTFAGTANEKQTFTVTVLADTIVELDEFFNVSLFNVVPTDPGILAANINATDTAKGMITNDDSAKFSITGTSTIVEGGQVLFTVSLSNPVDVATSVTVTTTDGSAKSTGPLAFDKDYTSLMASVVNFAAGVTSVVVPVQTTADNIVELDETFTIDLGGLNNGGRTTVTIDAANSTGTGTITNDDSAQFKITSVASAIEGKPITFTVSLTNPVDVATSVTVTTADLTAMVADNDYTPLMAQLVSFPALTTSVDVMVNTTSDVIVEADETLSITLGDLVNGGRPTVTISAADKVGIGTITNDDKATLLTIANVSVNEDTGTMTFTVTLSADVQDGFNVDIMTKDGTTATAATTADNDYTFTMKTLTFAGMKGEVQKFTVPITLDNKVEADETFTVHLANVVPNNAKVMASDIDATSVGIGTILNDDMTALTVADITQNEAAGTMTFTVTLSNPVQGGFTVNFATADDTAKSLTTPASDKDYTANSGTLTFAGKAGETQTFTVSVLDDNIVEPDEQFKVALAKVVTLGAGVDASKIDATDGAVGKIVNDDSATISLFASTDTEGNNLVYTVKLSNPVSKDVSVDFATLAGVGIRPAVSNVDFTAVASKVTFAALNQTQTVLVPLTDDRRVEGSEQFDSKIANIQTDASVSAKISIATANAVATITDNDTAVFAFTKAGNGALEDNVAGVTATVQLTVNATGTGTDGLDRPITIRVTDSMGGTATNGVDYKNFTNPTDLTFVPADFKSTALNIAFDLVEDLNKEGDETIVFNIAVQNDTTATQAKIGAVNVHTFTIQSDDETTRTYDATVTGDYRFVNDGAGNVQLFLGKTLLSMDQVGTQPILLNGTAGVDSATVDYTAGSPVPTGGLTFNGNDPAAGERLLVNGGTFASLVNTLTTAQSGTIVLTGTTTDTLNYTAVDLVEINASKTGDLTIQLPSGASQVILEDDGTAGNNTTQIRSGNGTFATTKFVNPTGTLTILTGNAADTLTIADVPDLTASVLAGTTAARFDSITQNGDLNSKTGQVRYFAKTITINDGADLTAASDIELNSTGVVTFGGTNITSQNFTQTGGGSVAITAGDLANITANSIIFDGTIDGPGSLTTNSGGNVVFNKELGMTTSLNAATFNSPINATATNVMGGALNIRANSMTFNGVVTAPNAPVVLTLTGGNANQTAEIITTMLFLNGDGNFNLNHPQNLLTGSGKTVASFVTKVGGNTVTDEVGLQALPGELFVNLNSGSIDVRDQSDLVIRYLNSTAQPALFIGNNGNATLTTGGDLSIEDSRTQLSSGVAPADIAATPLINVGTGKVQVNVGVDRDNVAVFNLANLVTQLAATSTLVRFSAEAKAGLVTLGSLPTPATTDNLGIRLGTNFSNPANLENVSKDIFTIRPAIGSPLRLLGNSPVLSDDSSLRPFDSLTPRFAVAGNVSFAPNGTGNGTFSFGAPFQKIDFESIESIGGLQANAYVVQTGPSVTNPSNQYAIRLNATIDGKQFGQGLSGSGIITNPFVVSPSLGGLTLFNSPQITIAEVDGDGNPDLIVANGSGDAPLVTIIRGSSIFFGQQAINLSTLQPSQIIAQFFAFEESFRGGVNVRAVDFNNDGKAEIAVSAGNGGGPRITVFQVTDVSSTANVFQNVIIYGSDKGTPYNFFPYESSFRGGVNVAVGDVNGDGVPDIIAGAGIGGGPRVRVYDGTIPPSNTDNGAPGANIISDFFAYDPGFRGGVFVDAGRFDTDLIADLVTAPGPGGSAHIQVFQGRNTKLAGTTDPYAVDPARGTAFRIPMASFDAFMSQADLFNPQPSRTGVGGIAFGSSTDGVGSSRSILVTRPEGQPFEVLAFAPATASTVLTPADIANGSTLITVGTTNGVDPLIVKRTPRFQTLIANDLPFDSLQDGGSATGSS